MNLLSRHVSVFGMRLEITHKCWWCKVRANTLQPKWPGKHGILNSIQYLHKHNTDLSNSRNHCLSCLSTNRRSWKPQWNQNMTLTTPTEALFWLSWMYDLIHYSFVFKGHSLIALSVMQVSKGHGTPSLIWAKKLCLNTLQRL